MFKYILIVIFIFSSQLAFAGETQTPEKKKNPLLEITANECGLCAKSWKLPAICLKGHLATRGGFKHNETTDDYDTLFELDTDIKLYLEMFKGLYFNFQFDTLTIDRESLNFMYRFNDKFDMKFGRNVVPFGFSDDKYLYDLNNFSTNPMSADTLIYYGVSFSNKFGDKDSWNASVAGGMYEHLSGGMRSIISYSDRVSILASVFGYDFLSGNDFNFQLGGEVIPLKWLILRSEFYAYEKFKTGMNWRAKALGSLDLLHILRFVLMIDRLEDGNFYLDTKFGFKINRIYISLGYRPELKYAYAELNMAY